MVRKVSLKMASPYLDQCPACLPVCFQVGRVGEGSFLFLEQTNLPQLSNNHRISQVLIAKAEAHTGVLNPGTFVKLCIKWFSFVNLGNSLCTVAEKQ